MEISRNAEIAQTILTQLGGGKFKMMTGAKHCFAIENGLSFRLPGAGGFCKNDINYVTVILEPSDTYTVAFKRVRGDTITEVSKHTDIYCDTLVELFERETGLATRLPRVIFA